MHYPSFFYLNNFTHKSQPHIILLPIFNNNKQYRQMSFQHIDSGSSSESPSPSPNKKGKTHFSILKHLPQARKIMLGQTFQPQQAKCVFQTPLSTNPAFIFSNYNSTAIPSQQRLVKIEDAIFEHQKICEKVRNVLGKEAKKNTENSTSLWNTYSSLSPAYARFGQTSRKSNFANVLLPVNGINISLPYSKIVPNTNSPQNMSNSIYFDSNFESGNLLLAYRRQWMDMQTYDLILQNDTNTKGHNQWFFFKVHNTKNHNKVRFNIVNFIKDESMFSYGIKPLTFSEKSHHKHKTGWIRSGQKVQYTQSNIKREQLPKYYHTLSFEYYFTQQDTVYFAPVHPYTFTQLNSYYDTLLHNHSITKYLNLKSTAETVGGNILNVVTIGTGKKCLKQCGIIWVIGRQHPGETTGSFMAQGIIKYLVNLYSSPPLQMVEILNNLIFKIVPMLNIDGVIHGNTRSELTGVDPNRMWKKTVKRLSPGVSAIKKLIGENKENVKLVLDLHSHSKKLGCFFYGNSIIYDPKSVKVYPTLVCEDDCRFELKYCRFRGGYDTTARSVLFYELGIKQVYTVECSLLGYLKKNRITEYQIEDYYDMGKRLIQKFLLLEKSKDTKQQNQIVEEMGDRILDIDDAQSARSESSLSDQEYEEIRCKAKKNKRRKVKKSESENVPVENSKNNEIKYFIKRNSRNNTRVQMSLNDKNEKKKNAFREHSNIDLKVQNQNLLNPKTNESQRQSSFKKCRTLKDVMPKINLAKIQKYQEDQKTRKNNASFTKAKVNGLINTKEIPRPIQKKQVQIQVTALINFSDRAENKRYGERTKKDNSLCVVGSSLEDDLVQVWKNQIGVQVYQDIIEQNLGSEANIKSMKLKKMPKLLNYFCSNLIGVQPENSVFPQDRRLAPLLTKKNIGKI